jgi:hypothetical protein
MRRVIRINASKVAIARWYQRSKSNGGECWPCATNFEGSRSRLAKVVLRTRVIARMMMMNIVALLGLSLSSLGHLVMLLSCPFESIEESSCKDEIHKEA